MSSVRGFEDSKRHCDGNVVMETLDLLKTLTEGQERFIVYILEARTFENVEMLYKSLSRLPRYRTKLMDLDWKSRDHFKGTNRSRFGRFHSASDRHRRWSPFSPPNYLSSPGD